MTLDNTDTLASQRRARDQPQSTGKRITLQPRDWLWLQCLQEHGPLAASFLLAFANGLGRSEKRAQERLTDLFHEANTRHRGPYLTRPPQQFHTLDSRYQSLVYDLAPAGKRALQEQEAGQMPDSQLTGPWLHRFMVSSITASIQLAAVRQPNLRFIPQAEILRRATTGLCYPLQWTDPETGKHYDHAIQPDAVFGLEYQTMHGARFRFFAVEADRSTEPYSSRHYNRKSMLRSYMQYREYIGGGRYKQHLQLTAPLLLLFVCTDTGRAKRIQELISQHTPQGNAYVLLQSWTDFASPFRVPKPNPELLYTAWQRAGLPPFRIDQV